MTTTTLLDLPTELLDKIYSYLDWDRTVTLEPNRTDIFNISLVCRQLRRTILPTVFRDVTLRLRWVDGALVEPRLLQLRRDYSHLAKHIRCVYIKTLFGQYPDPDSQLASFVVPEDLNDWLQPAIAEVDGTEQARTRSHRQRVNDAARKITQSFQHVLTGHECPQELRDRAEKLARQLAGGCRPFDDRQPQLSSASSSGATTHGCVDDDATSDEAVDLSARYETEQSNRPTFIAALSNNDYRTPRLQLDALIIVMLCFPPSLNCLYYESLPSDRTDTVQNAFSLHVAATAMQIFGDRLQHLAMVTCSPARSSRLPNRMRRHQVRDVREEEVLVPEVLSHLQSVGTLTFATDMDYSHYWPNLVPHDVERWHSMPSNIARLELTNMQGESPAFVKLIQGFSHLNELSFNNVIIVAPPRQGAVVDDRTDVLWLVLLVDLRRLQPGMSFHLRNLSALRANPVLPDSAINWLLKEAVPVGSNVGMERETRLAEDFESFLPLWRAEDSRRGALAKDARLDGKLVDLAMSSRWQTFANMR